MSVAQSAAALLDGEDPATVYARDARHWISIYRRMIAFNRELLKRAHGVMAAASPQLVGEEMPHDVTSIEAQLERYQERIEYWLARQLELEDIAIDADTRTVTHAGRSVTLTRRELQLFTTLVARSPELMRPQALLLEAWGDENLLQETLRTYVVRLRTRIDELGLHAQLVNRRRLGYGLVFEDAPAASHRESA